MDELIDVVNEKNEVIGTAFRREAWKKKLSRRVSHLWVFNNKGELLISKRPLNIKPYPGIWTSTAGGHVAAGESHEQAAYREAQEELGVVFQSLTYALTLNYHHPDGHLLFIGLWYCVREKGTKGMSFDAAEIAETRWISLPKLKREMKKNPEIFNPEFVQLVELWGEKKLRVK